MKSQTYFRGAFTLIELLISISILSIMMIFLYKSYASLNSSNTLYKKEVKKITDEQMKKKVVFLDFSLIIYKSVNIVNHEKNEDLVFMQTSNSIHDNYNPYVEYRVKNSKLYRLESFKPFDENPLDSQSRFTADELGAVNSFRVYKSDNNASGNIPNTYLVHIDFKNQDDILYKIKALNEY